MLGAGGDRAADSVQSCKRLPPAEEGKEENADYPAGEDSGLPESSGGMGVLPMFYLELSTGLRRGELVALLWSDLNLQTKTLTVSKSVSRGKGELVVTEPKTENSVREIYLSDEAIRLLVEDSKPQWTCPSERRFETARCGVRFGDVPTRCRDAQSRLHSPSSRPG